MVHFYSYACMYSEVKYSRLNKIKNLGACLDTICDMYELQLILMDRRGLALDL